MPFRMVLFLNMFIFELLSFDRNILKRPRDPRGTPYEILIPNSSIYLKMISKNAVDIPPYVEVT